jgi:hypothetical protein
MSQSDPTAVLAEMKRTEALLRDARSVLRRVDALAAKGHLRRSEPHAHCRGANRRRAPGVSAFRGERRERAQRHPFRLEHRGAGRPLRGSHARSEPPPDRYPLGGSELE